MAAIAQINAFVDELRAIRQDIHAHPEIGFEEHRTSAIVADNLAKWGIDVHRGFGTTGVVGIIQGSRPGAAVGLRADMDALPMQELSDRPYRSTRPGAFHGCGHDGHTAMLLGAVRYLADTRDFPGTVVAIFQPAEEGLGGAKAMISDGLFDRFPCDEIYALHNWPGSPRGVVTATPGPAMAATDFFDINIIGRGAHAALPQTGLDPVVVAASLVQALQTIVSRNVDPLRTAVVSVTQIHAGTAYNVIPDSVYIAGTVRTFDEGMREYIRGRIQQIAKGIGDAFGAKIEITIKDIYRVLCNGKAQVDAAIDIAREIVSAEMAHVVDEPMAGGEDFADMLACVPGAYIWLGQGDAHMLHNPSYDFDDAILPIGAS
ncbi:MAG TPA: M20 aminoacylase family protein, partial [Methylovirgula sp.]|nr:M20 aminoacylase family protein [Methylovirgula sp.]